MGGGAIKGNTIYIRHIYERYLQERVVGGEVYRKPREEASGGSPSRRGKKGQRKRKSGTHNFTRDASDIHSETEGESLKEGEGDRGGRIPHRNKRRKTDTNRIRKPEPQTIKLFNLTRLVGLIVEGEERGMGSCPEERGRGHPGEKDTGR